MKTAVALAKMFAVFFLCSLGAFSGYMVSQLIPFVFVMVVA